MLFEKECLTYPYDEKSSQINGLLWIKKYLCQVQFKFSSFLLFPILRITVYISHKIESK